MQRRQRKLSKYQREKTWCSSFTSLTLGFDFPHKYRIVSFLLEIQKKRRLEALLSLTPDSFATVIQYLLLISVRNVKAISRHPTALCHLKLPSVSYLPHSLEVLIKSGGPFCFAADRIQKTLPPQKKIKTIKGNELACQQLSLLSTTTTTEMKTTTTITN